MQKPLLLALLLSFPSIAEANMPSPKNIHFSILAGGGGTRLWPLSRDHKPKQFLELGDMNLIEQSVARLKLVPGFQQTKIVMATAANLHAQMEAQVRSMGLQNEVTIIADPSRRDTGPAILLNVLEVLKHDPEATLVFLPADPYIPKEQSADFVAALTRAIARVEDQPSKIVLLGKTPTYPATGFGYIETGALMSDALSVASFKEKPDARQAADFISQQRYLWNMGIFVGKAKFFARLFETYAPGIFAPVSSFTRSYKVADYNAATSVSVDIAIMQPASKDGHLLVVPVNFDWQDVGDVKTYLELQNDYLMGVGRQSLVYEHKPDAFNNLVYTSEGKLVTLVGVSGLCVVDTPDALLIIPCDQAQKVKGVVDNLKADRNLKRFVE